MKMDEARDVMLRRAAVIAKREHRKIMAAEPRPDGFTRVVNGVEGAPEESIQFGRSIVYFYERLSTIAQEALEILREMSPVQSGLYRDSHMLLVDGQPVADLSGYRAGSEISITNLVPYSRRLEVGKTKSGRSFVIQVKPRIYQRARARLMRRFGNQVSIEYTFRAFMGGGQVNPLHMPPALKRRTIVRGEKGRFAKGTKTVRISGGEHNKPDIRYPTLVFHPAGTTFGRRRRYGG